MADTVLVRKNTTAGTVPTAAQLAVGELALNTGDGSLYAKIAGVVQKVQAKITLYSVLVDFGSVPDQSAVFTATVTDAIVGQRVIASIGADVPGSLPDELEMEPLVVFGRVIANQTVEFLVSTADPFSLVVGQRYINFYMG